MLDMYKADKRGEIDFTNHKNVFNTKKLLIENLIHI